MALTIYSLSYASFLCKSFIMLLYEQPGVCFTLLPNTNCSVHVIVVFLLNMNNRRTPERIAARSRRLSDHHSSDSATELERNYCTPTPSKDNCKIFVMTTSRPVQRFVLLPMVFWHRFRMYLVSRCKMPHRMLQKLQPTARSPNRQQAIKTCFTVS